MPAGEALSRTALRLSSRQRAGPVRTSGMRITTRPPPTVPSAPLMTTSAPPPPPFPWTASPQKVQVGRRRAEKPGRRVCRPRASLSLTGITSGNKNRPVLSQVRDLRLRELGSLAGESRIKFRTSGLHAQALTAILAHVRAMGWNSLWRGENVSCSPGPGVLCTILVHLTSEPHQTCEAFSL